MVQILLDGGVDGNAEGEFFAYALQVASFGGREKVVQMLLEQGADINAQQGDDGNVLQAASSNGHEKVVHSYWTMASTSTRKVDCMATDFRSHHPEDHEKQARILVDQGASRSYGNAFQAASSQDCQNSAKKWGKGGWRITETCDSKGKKSCNEEK